MEISNRLIPIILWKNSGSELGFTRFRKRMHGLLGASQAKWLLADKEFLALTYQGLCNFTHSRPDSSDGALWESNGPVFNQKAVMLTFFTALSTYAICYLLVRIARPGFKLPTDSRILFEEDWMLNRTGLIRAFEELYKERAARSQKTVSKSRTKKNEHKRN